MINLYNLEKETLIQIIQDLDQGLIQHVKDEEFNALANDHQFLLERVNDEIRRKIYWRNKYNELEKQIKPVQRRITEVKPIVKREDKTRTIKLSDNKTSKTKIKPIRQKDYITRDKDAGYKVNDTSTAGNVSGSKHSGHLNKDTLFQVTFKDGTKKQFETVNGAKEYIWEHVPSLRDSKLTNVSAAGRRTGSYKSNNGYAYGLKFDYVNKEVVK